MPSGPGGAWGKERRHERRRIRREQRVRGTMFVEEAEYLSFQRQVLGNRFAQQIGARPRFRRIRRRGDVGRRRLRPPDASVNHRSGKQRRPLVSV